MDTAPSADPIDLDVPINEPQRASEPNLGDDLPEQTKTTTAATVTVAELTSQEIREIRKPKGKKTKKKTRLIDETTRDKEVQELCKSRDKTLFTRDDKYGWLSKGNDFAFHGLINSTVNRMFERPLINLHEEVMKSMFK